MEFVGTGVAIEDYYLDGFFFQLTNAYFTFLKNDCKFWLAVNNYKKKDY